MLKMIFLSKKNYNQIITDEKGFTLVELMVAIVIALIVTAAVSQLFINEKKLYISQNQIIDMQQDIRTSLTIMTSEIRMAAYNPQNVTQFEAENSIIKTDPADFIFLADMNDDGFLDIATERFRYTLNNNGQLCRAVGDDSSTLIPIANNVNLFNLTYIYEPTTSTKEEDLRSIKISLTVKLGDAKREIFNQIKFRNLGIRR